MMLVASGSAVANCYAFMPVHRQGDETLSIWLQVSSTVLVLSGDACCGS